MPNRLRIKIVGESGSGLLSTGDILTKSLQNLGFNMVSDREYQSLIKGGCSCYTLNLSRDPVKSLSRQADIMFALDKQGLEKRYHEVRDGGWLIHGYEKLTGIEHITESLTKRGVKIVNVPSRQIAIGEGGNLLMTNVVLLGVLWKVMGLDYKVIEKEVKVKFASKPKLLALDLKCLKAGYERVESEMTVDLPDEVPKRYLVNGNKAIALGAVHCGCRAFFAYPMSPASSILTHMAEMAMETDVLVKQVEDEISVAQMSIGASYMGTRALCATSGGGFDLMTESVSLAGIIETPFVVVIAQRPGPGTGLPTWTGQGDLNLAIHAGHGEFARMVVAVSDPEDAFELTQHAFNYADKYQCPVIILTEKVIAESLMSIDAFKEKTVPIERGLVTSKAELAKLKNTDRYKITKSGVSKRWVPGSSEAYYFANGDEHLEDGSLTEDAEPAREMYAKRVRKLKTMMKEMPEPEVYGASKDAEISFVGWGSTKNTMLDVIQYFKKQGVKVNYLHYSYVWPIKTKRLRKFMRENAKVHILEGNYTGQLARLLEAEGIEFAGKLNKYDGRQFFIEDVIEYITEKR